MMFVLWQKTCLTMFHFSISRKKHNSVNQSVCPSPLSQLLKPDGDWRLIRKYQFLKNSFHFFFVKPKDNFWRNFFYVHLNSNYVTPTYYFDCESKIIIWIMCVLMMNRKNMYQNFFLQIPPLLHTYFLPASKTWLKSIFYTKRRTKYGVILTNILTLIFMFLAVDLFSKGPII